MPLPMGLIQTAAQATALRIVRRAVAPRRRKRRSAAQNTRRAIKRQASGTRRKPKPGTKAWMSYIRSKRKKK